MAIRLLAKRFVSIPASTSITLPLYCRKHPPPAILHERHSLDRKVRILVDMDGVLADFESHLMQIYTREEPEFPVLPEYMRKGLCIDQQYEEAFPDKPETAEKLREIMMRKHFFRDLPPIPQAVNKIHCLLDNPNYDVSVCTSPLTHNAYCTSEKLEWLEKYFGRRFHRKVIMTNDKTVINADFLLDDKEEITGAIERPCFTHILVRQVHNQHVTFFHRDNILEDWSDLDRILDKSIRKLA